MQHRPARQGEGINRGIGNDFEGEWESALPCFLRAHQTLADAVHIVGEHRVMDDLHLLPDLCGVFLAQLNVLFL